MLKNIKAVIFDLDGTLIDSNFIWRDIDIEFLGKRNIPMPETLQRDLEGKSMAETAVYFQETFHLQETVEELMNIWNEMARDIYLHQIKMKPGAKEFLQYLKEQQMPIGIATSNSKELVDAAFIAHGLDNYIDCFVSANEVAAGKPAPDVYLETARRMKVQPKNCLIFEDIIAGVMAGKSAGMNTCAVYDEFSADTTEEKRKLADYYITDYFEILNMFCN